MGELTKTLFLSIFFKKEKKQHKLYVNPVFEKEIK